MVKLRLQRRGRKKLPFYKIIVADSRAPRDGRFIEAIGEYNPLPRPAHIVLNEERALYWLGVGAQPTDTVRNILTSQGILLRRHMIRKGKAESEIQEEITKWREARTERLAKARNKKEERAAKKKAEKAAETEKSEAAPAEESAPAAEEKPASE